MATDGPGPVEQVEPPKSKGILGRFKRQQSPPATETKAPVVTSKESLPGKMGAVMTELKKKDQELDGTLISEFGEGESKFVALRKPLEVDEGKDLPEGQRVGKKGFEDHLLVTSDGFKILRVIKGQWGEPDAWLRENSPEVKDQFHRRPEDDVMSDTVRQLIRRGNAEFRADKYTQAWIHLYSLEGSGYFQKGTMLNLNFGKGPSLEFSAPYGYLQGPSRELRLYLKENRSYGGQDADRGIERIRGDAAQLILNPDTTEVAEIMQMNIEEAKKSKDAKEAERLADEAKKLAEAEEAKKPETEKLAAEETKKQEDARQAAAQAQTADSVLDMLGKS